jgi:hypothetical protein
MSLLRARMQRSVCAQAHGYPRGFLLTFSRPGGGGSRGGEVRHARRRLQRGWGSAVVAGRNPGTATALPTGP